MSTNKKCLVLLDTTLNGLAIGVAELLSGQPSWMWVSLQQNGTAIIDQAWQFAIKEIRDRNMSLAGVCVANGPGSFTGIKIGLSFVQGLARGDTNRLFFVCRSSLKSLARFYSDRDPHCFAVVLPATKTRGAAAIITQEGTKIFDLDTTLDLTEFKRSGNTYLLAPWPMLESRLADLNCSATCINVDRELVLKASLEALAKEFINVGDEQLRREYATHATLEPFYLRASTAEEVKFGKPKY